MHREDGREPDEREDDRDPIDELGVDREEDPAERPLGSEVTRKYTPGDANATGTIFALPLSSIADGANGVYGSAAGVFPTQSFSSSNYFVDVVVQ